MDRDNIRGPTDHDRNGRLATPCWGIDSSTNEIGEPSENTDEGVKESRRSILTDL